MAEIKNNESYSIPIPKVEILEIDKAVYDWFDKKHSTNIDGRKTPVVFGAWERFAQIQGNKSDKKINEIRDKNGKIKLPLISIRRGDITPNENRYTKIDSYGEPAIEFFRRIGVAKFDKDRRIPFTKKWMMGNSQQYVETKPSYEVYRIPFPSFINIIYMITFWSSYVKHSNLFQKKVWSEYRLPDLRYQNYFFYSYFDNGTDQSNTEDFSTEERTFKHEFSLNVEAYLIDRDKVSVSRTPSKFVFEEKIVDAEAMPERRKEAIYESDSKVQTVG